MKKIIYNLLLLNVLFIVSLRVLAQEQRYVTAEYSIPKEQCEIYAYDLEDFLKSKGLYGGQKTNYKGVGKIKWMKKKVYIGGIDFTKDCTFILELLGDRLPKDEDPYEFLGSFGIIEIGFKTESKAKEVYEKANLASKKYPMNIPIYHSIFRCVQVRKSVIFVYAINTKMYKYRDMIETWSPKKKEEDKEKKNEE